MNPRTHLLSISSRTKTAIQRSTPTACRRPTRCSKRPVGGWPRCRPRWSSPTTSWACTNWPRSIWATSHPTSPRRPWRSTRWPAWSRGSATASVQTPAPCAMRSATSGWRSSRSSATAQADGARRLKRPDRRRAAPCRRAPSRPRRAVEPTCSRSWPGTSRPAELTTRHHGRSSSSLTPGCRPTRRDCFGIAGVLGDVAVGHDLALAERPDDVEDRARSRSFTPGRRAVAS